MSDLDMMLRFMLQAMVVLVACRVFGWLGKRFLGQAQVTMEMLTGIILGPSVFGLLAPQIQRNIFPQFTTIGDLTSAKHPSMSVLYVVAQIGLVLYMFVVGLELDLSHIRRHVRSAISVSAAGILVPFVLGCLLFFGFLGNRTDMLNAAMSPTILAVYVGAAMSITAFPVLARLIYEAGVQNTTIGTLTLSSGAMDDIAAWSLLAAVLAASKGNPSIALWAILGGIAFVAVMLSAGRRVLTYIEAKAAENAFSLVLVLLFFGAWFTDEIGIHAVFGAFIVGVAMPKGAVSEQIRARIEPLATGLFVPFFFVFSGLNTKITSLVGLDVWLIALLALAVAIVGKVGGCYAAARACGESHRQSLSIGVLMNSRGMMGLIILNIGLQQKIISTQFFTIMVIMCVVTTFLAAPLFRKIYRPESEAELAAAHA